MIEKEIRILEIKSDEFSSILSVLSKLDIRIDDVYKENKTIYEYYGYNDVNLNTITLD